MKYRGFVGTLEKLKLLIIFSMVYSSSENTFETTSCLTMKWQFHSGKLLEIF
jgi:hypothetical protein